MNFGFQTKRIAILALSTLVGLAPLLIADDKGDNKPSIISAVPVYITNPHQLVITGSGLSSGKPVVTIAGLPALVLAYTNNIVAVQIPLLVDVIPGTYVLTLATGPGNGANQTDMEVALLGLSSEGGSAGATGPQGPAGPAGVAGAKGATGAQGSVGPAGATGAQGLVGPAGAAGAKGATGAQGLAGPTGATGVQGLVGPAGATGAQGLTGATGAIGGQGPAGATGAQGPVGPQGVAGINGVNGAPGATGAVGPMGPAGPGGGALLVSTVTIHRVDMLALDQTPVTLLPAVPNVVNVPLRIMVQVNNAVYTTPGQQMNFSYGTIASPAPVVNSAGFLFPNGFTKYLDDTSFQLLTNDDASKFVGQPYIVFTSSPVTEQGGTGGDVILTVWYTALPVQ